MMQIVGISVITLLLALLLRNVNQTASVILIICASGLLFIKISASLGEIISALKELSSGAEEAYSYIILMLKVLGIALITQLTADICRDAGESALAGQTEVASKIIIIAMIMPLFEAIIKSVSGLLI